MVHQHYFVSSSLLFLLVLFSPTFFFFVEAVPGPDTTAVLANANVPESVTLAYYYAQQRSIPRKQVCLLNVTAGDGVNMGAAISLAVYKKDILYPTRACLQAAGVEGRIEAFMLVRGIPIRVTYSSGSCSLAATLQVWFSPATTGSNTLWIDSNNPSVDAHINNLYTAGPFYPNYTTTYSSNTQFQFRLATMLNGRSYADATSLVDTAIKAEAYGWSPATMAGSQFLLMKGPTSDPRTYLDSEFPGVCAKLISRGYNCTIVPFNANLIYRSPLASFMVGTASMGSTIEGNNYTSCAIVDNLTSYGAVAVNFQATGQSQVSISRWVERGVLAVHGTVEEPYADAFPSRYLLVDYVDGYTVGESYLMEMPEFFWMNLVVGDVMAAPFAERPVITFQGGYDSDTRTFCGSSSCSVKISAAAPSDTPEPANNGKGNIGWIGLYVNGDLVDEVTSNDGNGTAVLTLETRSLDPSVYSSSEDLEVLIVAQYAQAPKSKGWMAINNATFVSEFPSSSAVRVMDNHYYSKYCYCMMDYLLGCLL